MRLELENLGTGGAFEHVYAPEDLPLEDRDLRLVEPARVRGRARRMVDEVQITGTLTAMVEAPCARCLKPVKIPIAADFSERFVTAVTWRSEEQHELDADDLNLAVFDGETIDLDQLVREEIVLATPSADFMPRRLQGVM